MKFIEVHTLDGNPVLVNLYNVCNICHREAGGTVVSFSEEYCIMVMELYTEVEDLIYNAYL